ncbi:hypothetical protein [Frigoribacterium sp. UYMn621]|uniref:hypothetical protein n=1 Tax=Frigoribacterium sp. UYMn621 TaxID=3156343 RepID=UPI003398F91B
MKSLLSASNTAKARVASIKERGGVLAVLRTKGGAIDLASIMVGVLVIGIIGGVIAVAVFAVIPWAQNEAAKGALESVKTAESVSYAAAAGNGTGKFASYADLVDGTGQLGGKSVIQDSKLVNIALSDNGDAFIALSQSATGDQFFITSENPSTVLTSSTADQAILTAFIGAHTGLTVPTVTP